MKKLVLMGATLLFALHGIASVAGGLSLELRKSDDHRMVELTFQNVSNQVIELEIPVEGSGDCAKYFRIEAVTKDGAPLQEHALYAPSIEPYTVKLKPGGIYVHRIQPGAYPNAADLQSLQKLRVSYTNPLTGKTTVSEWLVLAPK